MKLLALDTATERCSVALWLSGTMHWREAQGERGDGGNVLGLIEALLAEAGLSLGALDAIAFGRGPGAFTGVRLAATLTQGLAFSAGLPVLPVSDLRAVAQQALGAAAALRRVLVCHDARMGEVYWGGFEQHQGHAQAATAEAVARPEQLVDPARAWLGEEAAAGAGSGFALYPQLAAALAANLHPLLPALAPHAREIALLAAHDGLAAAVAPERALPVYVRNDVAALPAAAARAS